MVSQLPTLQLTKLRKYKRLNNMLGFVCTVWLAYFCVILSTFYFFIFIFGIEVEEFILSYFHIHKCSKFWQVQKKLIGRVSACFNQGVINYTARKTFAKEPEQAKFLLV